VIYKCLHCLVSSRHYRASLCVMLEIKSYASRPLTLHIDVDLLDIEALLCPGVFRWSQLYWTISHSASRLLIENHLADRHLVNTGSIKKIFVDQMTDRRCVDQSMCRSLVRRPNVCRSNVFRPKYVEPSISIQFWEFFPFV
jgi:hypothetical protein